MGGSVSDTTPAMALGAYVHALLSGVLADFEVRDFDSYRTKDAATWRDSVQADGKTPILESVADHARSIANAVRSKVGRGIDNDPFAENAQAQSEVTLVWTEGDGAHRVWCRARIDRLITGGAYLDWWDWKTCADITDRGIDRSVADRGYAIQMAFYERGVEKLFPEYAGRISGCLAFVESSAPHSVRRRYLSQEYKQWAARRVSEGIDEWRRCLVSGDWSDPQDSVSEEIALPSWQVRDDEIHIEE